MSGRILLIALLFLSTAVFSQTKKEKEEAAQLGGEAITLMDNGDFGGSIKLLKKAEKLDPENYVYPYEIAYAYYAQAEYEKSRKQLEKTLKYKNCSDAVYQLLGNCYDNLEETEKAKKVYKDGLKKFPNSGKLHLEIGIVSYFRDKDYDQAIAYWEQGVAAEPEYSSNYYWLSRVFCNTSERIWGIFYGEIFMNLERNSKRTAEISALLYQTYEASITVESDTSGSVDFSPAVINFDPSKKFEIPFNIVFGMDMSLGLGIEMIHNNDGKVSLESIDNMRQTFIKSWFENGRNKEYPNALINFQKKLKDAGHFEAYNHWFLMKGNEGEFNDWYDTNTDQFKAFVEWFNENTIGLNSRNYFSRLKQ